ncbi:MAG TPA: chromosomal replication initiator protein DnaA [Erysipelothrix sp.]|nr:chromosomal replication initiator protein DnaA [Erysipelothrix sp.]
MTGYNLKLDDLWSEVKSIIKKSEYFDDTIYQTYFDNTNLSNFDGNTATICVDSSFQKIILVNELPIISQTLGNVLNMDEVSCEIVLKSDQKNTLSQYLNKIEKEPVIKKDGIIPTQNFDTFVVGTSNKESHSAALGCAFKPGQFFTPLFIYGNSGLGKTHLLHSIGNYVKKNNPNANVLYISSSDFVRHVANSIGNGTIEDFKDQMNNLDVLLIDDIQFIAGKEKSHEIFFHIFNELVNNRKQIVITSDRLPTDIKGLEDRLISRFSSGLSVGVDTPEFETALAILYMKIKTQSLDEEMFSEDALVYIATHFSSDVRQLEGALNRLLFFSINNNNGSEFITLDTAINAFKGDHQPPKEIDAKIIKKIVADYYGLTISQLTGKSRTKAISNARHVAIFLTRKHLDLPYNKIGEEYGRRDHSTIISACTKIEKAIKTSEPLSYAIVEIEEKLSI